MAICMSVFELLLLYNMVFPDLKKTLQIELNKLPKINKHNKLDAISSYKSEADELINEHPSTESALNTLFSDASISLLKNKCKENTEAEKCDRLFEEIGMQKDNFKYFQTFLSAKNGIAVLKAFVKREIQLNDKINLNTKIMGSIMVVCLSIVATILFHKYKKANKV